MASAIGHSNRRSSALDGVVLAGCPARSHPCTTRSTLSAVDVLGEGHVPVGVSHAVPATAGSSRACCRRARAEVKASIGPPAAEDSGPRERPSGASMAACMPTTWSTTSRAVQSWHGDCDAHASEPTPKISSSSAPQGAGSGRRYRPAHIAGAHIAGAHIAGAHGADRRQGGRHRRFGPDQVVQPFERFLQAVAAD